MQRLATGILLASVIAGTLFGVAARPASATPFADIPTNHWAYQAIQSLAADGLVEGFPDGRFKGDRPMTRYEMAVVVARVIAKIQANGSGYASKTDLDKLQKLIDALKDELDSLGVRVTNVEDALDALDQRTKLAQQLQFHGTLQQNFSERTSAAYPQTIPNGTGVAQQLYYGPTVASGASASVDPLVDTFLRSDETNGVDTTATLGNYVRFDDRFVLSYAMDENLTISLPIHIIDYDDGGEFQNGSEYSVRPDIVVNVARTGNITNLQLRFGELDNLDSSRLGLTFRAPSGDQDGPAYIEPVQPYPTGIEIGGTFDGLTDFQVSFSRLDTTLLNTQLDLLNPSGTPYVNGYLFPTTAPQTGYNQVGPPGSTSGSLKTNSYTAGAGGLAQVALGNVAQLGTVYVSQYDGSSFNSAGQRTGGAASGPAAPPPFTYNSAYNTVVFQPPLAAGSSVTISYVGLTGANTEAFQRYEITARINQKIKGLPGGEIGLSYNRIFDTDDGAAVSDESVTTGASPDGYGLVSDTVLGLDTQLPLPFITLGAADHPLLFAEAAQSQYTPDVGTVTPLQGRALVAGIKLKVYGWTGVLQYQTVGENYLDGVPTQYLGNAPQLLSYSNLAYFPGFFGFANNLAINEAFDAATGACSGATKTNCTQVNPNLTFLYPIFNPFQIGASPTYFSAYAPNTQGLTLNLNGPLRIGSERFNLRLIAQRLQEIEPDAAGTQLYAAYGGIPSSVRMTLNKLEGGAQFNVPVFHGTSLGLNLSGGVEHLARYDTTQAGYIPLGAATLTADPGSAALGTTVPYFPNYLDMVHTTVNAAASLPLSRDVVFGASYNTQGFHGADGTTISDNISERKDTYAGSLTYNIPRTTSQVTFSLHNYHYSDAALPSYDNVENAADVNFIVRF